jgi:hypothetical protein
MYVDDLHDLTYNLMMTHVQTETDLLVPVFPLEYSIITFRRLPAFLNVSFGVLIPVQNSIPLICTNIFFTWGPYASFHGMALTVTLKVS